MKRNNNNNLYWTFGRLGEIVATNTAVALNTEHFTQQEWGWINEATDGWRQDVAIACYVRSWYRHNRHVSDNGLPCKWCSFVEDETTEHGWVWLTCNDPAQSITSEGCDWGNL